MNQPEIAHSHIVVRGARVHNLQDVDLKIPHNRLVVITGVSGSGKSSLAFDTICREGQRRYLESFSTRARQLLGKLGAAEVDSIDHLSPAIAIDQKTASGNPRSTVGTMSEIYDHLRLLFARLGVTPNKEYSVLNRSLFSFNSTGACETCHGLGVTDQIDPHLLISDPALTLRQGALVITTDSGYIIYSQVTMEVLNSVCNAHGFDVDIPWCDLTAEQKQIILYGSRRLKIPFGKHTLESRMKWSGIKARPRQEGFYGGIIPVMEQILKRDRNKNILRFARTGDCPVCQGTRLCPEARAVKFADRSIADFAEMTIAQLATKFNDPQLATKETNGQVFTVIKSEILQRCSLLMDLGLGYLTLDRKSPTLSGGEAQSIRLATVVGSSLQGMTYVLDEPSVGLHPRDNARLLGLLRRLVDQGNTVIVVEHDESTMMAADWLIDIGPGAGGKGGEVLFSGPPKDLLALKAGDKLSSSITRKFFLEANDSFAQPNLQTGAPTLKINNAATNNLQNFDLEFPLGCLSVVTGVSGSGKSSLLQELKKQVTTDEGNQKSVDQMVIIDQSPIGRTPRSNPATYTKIFDSVRSVFAAQPGAKSAGLTKGKFSFNNKGGRCEECQGAGVQTIGMHFLGDVQSTCPHCRGQRFLPQILDVQFQEKNIHQVLEMSVDEALLFFAGEMKIHRQLLVLQDLGLGYLSLGQPSTTLSGGEAQRIKLAAELGKTRQAKPLYIMDEPTTGLHAADVKKLLQALELLTQNGATIVVSEHHHAVIRAAQWVVDLGPGSGTEGGRLLYCGPPEQLQFAPESVTGSYLFDTPGKGNPPTHSLAESGSPADDGVIALRGVHTHNLKNIDVDIPKQKITVITGVSGSGKSSLAMATLCSEGRNRYAENFSTYMRQMLTGRTRPLLTSSRGLSPTIAVGQSPAAMNRRSIVSTVAEIHPLLRLLMSRFGHSSSGLKSQPPASFFSFNDHRSACLKCRGLGSITVPDETKLITHPERSILSGAMDGHKTSRFYGEPEGQYTATLKTVAQLYGLDFSSPWKDLSAQARFVAMNGTGDQEYQVTWEYQRGGNTGTHDFNSTWPGFRGLILEEYTRKHDDRRGQAMLPIMMQDVCPECQGRRHSTSVLNVQFEGMNISELGGLTVEKALGFFSKTKIPHQLRNEILLRLQTLADLGLSYLNLDRGTETLSSGESQRVRLARQLGAKLCGVTYVLDEPTLGLHPQDIEPLWRTISRLRDDGNTVVVVEHDLDIIRQADWVIDLGPGPGVHGGEIVAQGTPFDIEQHSSSPTGLALRNSSQQPQKIIGDFGHKAVLGGSRLIIRDAHLNNLQKIDVGFSAGSLNAVTGVSGSGKSSLVFGVLSATSKSGQPVGCSSVEGLDQFAEIISVGRASQSSTRGSNPATVLGIMDPIRKLLAETDAAQSAKLSKKYFAAAQPGGRCEQCKGRGKLSVSMDFLSDITQTCEQCAGAGFNQEVLNCRIFGLNLVEIMNLTVKEAAEIFQDVKNLGPKLQQLFEVGLAYLKLGQETGTLSGGERQRLFLAKELFSAGKGEKLFLCDEPSAGLHEADIHLLYSLFRQLVDRGHTVIFIEHHQGLIGLADQVLELRDGLIRG